MSVSSSKASGLDVPLVAPLLRLASAETSPTCAALGTRRKQACMGSAQMRQQRAPAMHALILQRVSLVDTGFKYGGLPCRHSLHWCEAEGHAAAWAGSQQFGKGLRARPCSAEGRLAFWLALPCRRGVPTAPKSTEVREEQNGPPCCPI